MKPRVLLLCALALPTVLLGCSRKREAAPEAGGPASLVRVIQAGNEVEASSLAAKASLRCRDANQCPASVGMLVGRQGNDIFTCTASLVAPGLAITNAHCIPPSVRQLPQLCRDRVRIIFPGTANLPEQSLPCRQLVGASEVPNEASPDLALLTLEDSGARPTLAHDRGGLEPGEIFSVYKVNPDPRSPASPTGELVVDRCRTLANSFLFPNYASSQNPVFVADCVSLPGNSGAPLLRGRDLTGLLQASLSPTDEQAMAWAPLLALGEDRFVPTALGTSLHCLEPATNWRWNATCTPFDFDNLERPSVRSLLQEGELESLFAPYLQQTPHLAWQRKSLVKHLLESSETIEPSCVTAATPNLASTEVLLSVTLPVVSARIQFNRYAQASAVASVTKEAQETWKFSLEELRATGATELRPPNVRLPLCPN